MPCSFGESRWDMIGSEQHFDRVNEGCRRGSVEQAVRFQDKRTPCTKLFVRLGLAQSFVPQSCCERCCVLVVEIRKKEMTLEDTNSGNYLLSRLFLWRLQQTGLLLRMACINVWIRAHVLLCMLGSVDSAR